MASELLGRRHLAQVDPLQSREIGSAVAVRAEFESYSSALSLEACFVLFRNSCIARVRRAARRGGGILNASPALALRARHAARPSRPRARITNELLKRARAVHVHAKRLAVCECADVCTHTPTLAVTKSAMALPTPPSIERRPFPTARSIPLRRPLHIVLTERRHTSRARRATRVEKAPGQM